MRSFVLFEPNNRGLFLLITFLVLNLLKALQSDTCQVYRDPKECHFSGVQARS